MHATGPFEVKVTPQDDKLNDGVSRMLLNKQFHGDLEATSKGQMLATGSGKSSGVYVAIETATGTLQGPLGTKSGGFALYHTWHHDERLAKSIGERCSRFRHRPTAGHHRKDDDQYCRRRQALLRFRIQAASGVRPPCCNTSSSNRSSAIAKNSARS
jgi:hypothetical protein